MRSITRPLQPSPARSPSTSRAASAAWGLGGLNVLVTRSKTTVTGVCNMAPGATP